MNVHARFVGAMVGLGITVLMSSCEYVAKLREKDAEEAAKEAAAKEATNKEAPSADVTFLLSMSFDEAKNLSPDNLTVPPLYKIAADKIEVLKRHSSGVPKKVKATGHVYVQIQSGDEIVALGQEALIGTEDVILRGKPLMKRGQSVVEGLEDDTVFYVEGMKLRVSGKHRVSKEGEVSAKWKEHWREGPNTSLPALPEEVPSEIRGSPLLPLPSR